jgi:transcriptional regulator with XRE-family HTH domain
MIVVMKNQSLFRKLVKERRKALQKAGFPNSTISMWQHGHRRPHKSTAKRLVKILDIPLDKIPYVSMVVNE